jgi:hypothetical protein
MHAQEEARTRELEEQALRAHGILGRSGPYGSSLFAFEYELLPLEAKNTIELIARGGPFPYPEDGNLYQNRSRDLPGSVVTQYREFTVLTHLEMSPLEFMQWRAAPIQRLSDSASCDHARQRPLRGCQSRLSDARIGSAV